jgi:hypothetical protein
MIREAYAPVGALQFVYMMKSHVPAKQTLAMGAQPKLFVERKLKIKMVKFVLKILCPCLITVRCCVMT